MLKKDILNILTESAKSDDCFTNPAFSSSDASEFISIMEGMDIIEEEEVFFDTGMIPVINLENGSYLIEYDMLYKLMEHEEVSASDAVEIVSEYNRIQPIDMVIVFEDVDYIMEAAKKIGAATASLYNKGKMQNALKTVKDLRASGVRVCCKKKKKKKKKK